MILLQLENTGYTAEKYSLQSSKALALFNKRTMHPYQQLITTQVQNKCHYGGYDIFFFY